MRTVHSMEHWSSLMHAQTVYMINSTVNYRLPYYPQMTPKPDNDVSPAECGVSNPQSGFLAVKRITLIHSGDNFTITSGLSCLRSRVIRRARYGRRSAIRRRVGEYGKRVPSAPPGEATETQHADLIGVAEMGQSHGENRYVPAQSGWLPRRTAARGELRHEVVKWRNGLQR